jgi:hypothetical protein
MRVPTFLFIISLFAGCQSSDRSATPQASATVTSPSREYTAVDFRWLGDFPFDQNEGTAKDIPADRLALSGRRISVDGRMNRLGLEPDHVSTFLLTPETFNWHQPQLQACIFVHGSKPDASFELYQETVRVKGTLFVQLVSSADGPLYIFSMVADDVVPVPR